MNRKTIYNLLEVEAASHIMIAERNTGVTVTFFTATAQSVEIIHCVFRSFGIHAGQAEGGTSLFTAASDVFRAV